MSKAVAILLVSAFSFAASSHAETPCNFKGVSVGDKMTPAEVMAAFGVAKYKISPTFPSWEEREPRIQKYSSMVAAELDDWDIGPYCEDDYCRIPGGVGVGNNDHIPVSVFVHFPKGQVTAIDVAFSETYWNEILPILDDKYGSRWDVERDPDMVITDYETKKSRKMECITLNHKTGGRNPITGDRCEIWITNLDIIFQHHDPLGFYHSVFEIKLVSKNF